MKSRIASHISILVAAIILVCQMNFVFAATNKDTVIATVNGKPITQKTFNRYAIQRRISPIGMTPKQRNALINELINRELLYQSAVKIGVDKTPAIKSEIAYESKNIIASAMINRSSDRFAVSEKDMKKEYEARKGELAGKELKARHILVDNEKTAKEVIQKLNKGADFADLAKLYSTGPSATKGGELGWFRVGQMVKPFSDAASKLAKGEYTKTPVKTKFGWHVIQLEDSRPVGPPSYDSIKGQIKAGLQNKLIEKYIGELRKEANIKRN
jgi:peptidyl-prolyl cis-trans isomerase C